MTSTADAGRRAVLDSAGTVAGGAVVAAGTALLVDHGYPQAGSAWPWWAVVGAMPAGLAAVAVIRRRPRTTTPADRVTLLRTVLACACAAAAAAAVLGDVPARTGWLLALAITTLALDAVDGWVARRTGTSSAAGALLDMQVDAGVLLVLSAAVATDLGPWVLVIGAMRYVFVAAVWLRPAWAVTLPRSRFRVTVAAVQGAVLATAIAPFIPLVVARALVAAAVVLLLASFGSEVWVKERLSRR
jgi:phosphatidylglycerophosphate synthase